MQLRSFPSFAQVALVALALVGSSCDDHIVGQGVPLLNTCVREPPLDYENMGKGLIERHCRSCHGEFRVGAQRSFAPVGVDFDEEGDVLAWADLIYQEAVIDRTMPPAGGMLELERLLLEEWMRCDVFPKVGRVGVAGPDNEE